MSDHVKGMTSCRPPKSEISNENSNESQIDLINRRDAVNAIEEVWCKWDVNTIDRFRDELQERFVALPSAQPNLQPTCNLATDCISRREAIDAICTEGTRLERNGTVAMVEIKQWCVNILEALPSAQPDIIACGDCKHWICHDRRCGYWNHGVKPLEWCCHAERRTDG